METCDCAGGGVSRRDVLAAMAVAAAVPLICSGEARAADEAPAAGPSVVGWLDTKLKGAELTDNAATAVKGEPIILTRQGKTLIALSSKCTHKGCSVKDEAGKQALLCPCHKARFDLTGAVLAKPAKDPLERYALRLNASGEVEVDTSKKIARDAAEGTLTLP